MNAEARQFREQRFELLPYPFGNDFTGRVFQSRNFVQVVMIQLLIQWLEDRLYFSEVADPACVWIDLAFDIDGYAKGVAMQPSTFMPCGDMRESVSGFESKLFEQFHKMSL